MQKKSCGKGGRGQARGKGGMDRVAGRSAGAGDRETGGLMIYKKTQPFFFLLFFLLSILDSGILFIGMYV